MGRAAGRNRRGAGRDVVADKPATVSDERQGQIAPRWLLTSGVLALLGIGVSIYLTIVHYDEAALICGVGGCHTVQSSRYAEVAGIPIAVLGLLMYTAILGLAMYRWCQPDTVHSDTLTSVAFAIALAGLSYAAYLTWLEIAVIDASCQWCVVSALLTLGILPAEGSGVWRMLGDDRGGP
ncbi:MAG: vitamin K epoxide reductase family protein [Thermomicrobiales bacterium]